MENPRNITLAIVEQLIDKYRKCVKKQKNNKNQHINHNNPDEQQSNHNKGGDGFLLAFAMVSWWLCYYCE